MPAAAIALVLLSAVLHATWNALLKGAEDKEASAAIIVTGAGSLSAALALAFGSGGVPRAALPWAFATGAVEAVYFLTLTAALARLPLQSAYGISRGCGVLFVWPIALVFLDEQATWLALFGAATLAFGLFVQMRSLPRSRGLLFALGCAAAIALYPATYKRAIDTGIAPSALFALSLAVALPVQIVGLGSRRGARLRAALSGERRWLAFAAVCCAASFLIFLNALKSAGPAHVSAMRNTSVLFAAAWGWARGEVVDARSLTSALAITVGAALVAL
ncbi:MAG: EamA family transporter [Deltaproteobacteria bacterium]|nr:EamA family transporter [Deltaproteobacteria bacterium]